ncbi:hypothetical protein BDZ91DRAFT_764529 [Kalaharituber pfeilii]|nr:hypothetical protein BDZ91DRAFT_764529 [Kalaharituber pfeilii]
MGKNKHSSKSGKKKACSGAPPQSVTQASPGKPNAAHTNKAIAASSRRTATERAYVAEQLLRPVTPPAPPSSPYLHAEPGTIRPSPPPSPPPPPPNSPVIGIEHAYTIERPRAPSLHRPLGPSRCRDHGCPEHSIAAPGPACTPLALSSAGPVPSANTYADAAPTELNPPPSTTEPQTRADRPWHRRRILATLAMQVHEILTSDAFEFMGEPPENTSGDADYATVPGAPGYYIDRKAIRESVYERLGMWQDLFPQGSWSGWGSGGRRWLW